MTQPSPYARAIKKVKQQQQPKQHKLESRTFTLSRAAFKAICRSANRYGMSPSVYVECISMQGDLMELMHREQITDE